jgi:hypothetical protein
MHTLIKLTIANPLAIIVIEKAPLSRQLKRFSNPSIWSNAMVLTTHALSQGAFDKFGDRIPTALLSSLNCLC